MSDKNAQPLMASGPGELRAPGIAAPKLSVPEDSGDVLRRGLLLVAVFTSILCVTVAAYRLVQSGEAEALRMMAQLDAKELVHRIRQEVDRQVIDLQRLRFRPTESMAAAAEIRLREWPALKELSLVDSYGVCKWSRSSAGVGPLEGRQLLDDPEWSQAIYQWLETGREAAHVLAGGAGGQIAAVLPLDPAPRGPRRGGPPPERPPGPPPPGPPPGPPPFREQMLLVVLSADALIVQSLDAHLLREYDLELRDGAVRLAGNGPASGIGKPYGTVEGLELVRLPLALHMWPRDEAVRARMGRLPVLWTGALTAVLLTGALGGVLVYRTRQAKQSRAYLAALESLNEISTAVSAKLGAGREVAYLLAESGRRLLGMARSGIALLNEGKQSLEIYAFAGDIPNDAPVSFDLLKLPGTRQSIETGNILCVEDVMRHEGPLNAQVHGAFKAACFILIPLHVQGRCIGLMALSDSQPRKLGNMERRLAELLGSQASVILANNRLYEQTKKDAQTQAVLLRELHHRVKNSLAGIVGLLSMGDADLAPSARQWLMRVIDRIQTMARAHDLFAGAVERVSLKELVDQMLPSLSVLIPPEVQVRNEVNADLRLETGQAVSLAMVLHELCTNAVQHALGERGVLIIRSRMEDDRVAIDVIDSGAGAAGDGNGQPSEQSDSVTATAVGGMGLMLVRELVKRELGGAFMLRPQEGGGTVATVEIPARKQGAES